MLASIAVFTLPIGSFAQPAEISFTSGEKIGFSSTTEMTIKSPESMQFWSGEQMAFGSTVFIQFQEMMPDGLLQPCDVVMILAGPMPVPCEWWEVLDPNGNPIGEIHFDAQYPPPEAHIDDFWPRTPIPVPIGGVITAKRKIDIVEPCMYFEVHWPSNWWPNPCTWWEIMDPETGEPTGFEFHVDWTNESCEFHIDDLFGPAGEPFYIPPWWYYEIWARRKIPKIDVCDYFVVEEPPAWWPEPCTWWEIMDPFTGEPTGFEFHVDWTNESCEFHIDEITPGPYILPDPGMLYIIAEKKIDEIKPCDYFIVVNPPQTRIETCTWWEVLDNTGAPTGYQFHIDETDGYTIFHVDQTEPTAVITVPPSFTITVRKKIDDIRPCDWFKVTDPTLVPEPCTWWEVIDRVTGAPTGWEFHVDDSAGDVFHVDQVIPGPSPLQPEDLKIAEKKIDDIKPCDWFVVVNPPTYIPSPCSWWMITSPDEWAGVKIHVDGNDGIRFHIDKVRPDPIPRPPTVPPYVVRAIPTEEPRLPWYMKPPYPDYAPSGMPDFDQRQGGRYLWQNPQTQQWSHCGPVAVANSLWWLDSEFESNTIPPPTIIDNFPLVQRYGGWDDHDPQNVPWLVEHLAFLMDTDGWRTGIMKLGTDVFDMQAGITHYLSWSGVNPLGDVDGDGNVTTLDRDIVNAAMGTVPGIPGWDLRADIWPATTTYPPVADNIIDLNDMNLVMSNLDRTGLFYEHTVRAPIWDIIVEELLKCQDVVLLIAPWYWDPAGGGWYRLDEGGHFVTVAGLNATTMEIVLSDPINDNAEMGGPGDVPVAHAHIGPTTHNDAALVSHDMYQVIYDECPGGPLTILGYPGSIVTVATLCVQFITRLRCT
jgi:hypothetical protein